MLREQKQTLILLLCLVAMSIIIGLFKVDISGVRDIHRTLRFVEPSVAEREPQEVMTVALVACGLRELELAVSIQTMLMFTKGFLDIRIFADKRNKEKIVPLFRAYPKQLQKKFKYRLYDISIPEKQSPENWKNNLKLCCTQRIFFPEILSDVDRLIYVDTDTLFFVPVEELWGLFNSFNSVQIAAIAWHNEDNTLRTYNEFTQIPFYRPYGINSGVMLMDLNRMSAANWSASMDAYFDEYKDIMPYGDQDLMNIFFYYNPELLMKLDCKYNFRVIYCMFGGKKKHCQTAEREGVSILHGLRAVFRKTDPTLQGFKQIHEMFRLYDFSKPFQTQLMPLKKALYNMTRQEDHCRNSFDAILKRLSIVHKVYRTNSTNNQMIQ